MNANLNSAMRQSGLSTAEGTNFNSMMGPGGPPNYPG